MMKMVLVTDKPWHDNLLSNLKSNMDAEWVRISDKSEFTYHYCENFAPDWIFIPHWSYMIPKEIYENFKCVLFHMTDLPYGRGGSPLQNLIIRGHQETKISALEVTDEIDAGRIYLKKSLSLLGTAEEIFIRSSSIIEEMIYTIITNNPEPKKQKGEVIKFKRREPQDGDVSNLQSLDDVYDYIRMLDCKGYPKAYLETEEFKFEFTRASLKADYSIIADVRITEK